MLEDGTYPIGHPVKGTSIRILDAQGKEMPTGKTGEICIYGDGVSLGYIGDHTEENRVFEKLPDGIYDPGIFRQNAFHSGKSPNRKTGKRKS